MSWIANRRRPITLRNKAVLSIGAFAGLVVVTVWVSLYSLASLHDGIDDCARKTVRRLNLADVVSSSAAAMANAESNVVVAAYSKDAEGGALARQMFHENSSRFAAALGELRPLVSQEQSGQIVTGLQARVGSWLTAYAEVERLADAKDVDGAARALSERATPPGSALLQASRDLGALERELFDKHRGDLDQQYASSRVWLLAPIFGGCVTGILSALLLRSFTRQLRRVAADMQQGSQQVSSASEQVAVASQSLAQCTSEQAATLEQTSTSADEIIAIARRNAENTSNVAALMTTTERLVGDANRNLAEMVQSMQAINGSSEKISKIIRVIDEIAFQTNILALNAAVEAARAGETGMGFAVVADEVRSLAHRSAQAARDTAELIEESITRTNEGSRKLDQVGKSIHEMTGAATRVKGLMDEIQTGSQEQSRGIEQIAAAMGQMDQVTQRSASNAEQSAAAGEELATQARKLSSVVERLRGMFEEGEDMGWTAEPEHPVVTIGVPSPAPTGPAPHRAVFPLDDQEAAGGGGKI